LVFERGLKGRGPKIPASMSRGSGDRFFRGSAAKSVNKHAFGKLSLLYLLLTFYSRLLDAYGSLI